MIEDREGNRSARPVIVARCSDLRIAKRMLYVLKSFVDLDLGFGLLPWQDDIGLVGGSERDGSSAEPSVSLGGSRIFITSTPISASNSWNLAIVGGVLLLNQHYYGLTVAHASMRIARK